MAGSIILFSVFGLTYLLYYLSFTGVDQLIDTSVMTFASLFFFMWGKAIIFTNISSKNHLVTYAYRIIVILMAVLIPLLANYSNINIQAPIIFLVIFIVLILIGFDFFHLIDTALKDEFYNTFSDGGRFLGINIAIYIVSAVSLFIFYPYMKS